MTAEEQAAADKVIADKAAADKKVADDKAAADKVAADAAAAAAAAAKVKEQPKGAPDKYALQLPKDSTLGAEDLVYVEEIARAANMSNEDAQRVLDQHSARAEQVAGVWLEQTASDKEYGGAKLANTQRLARTVIDTIRPADHPRHKAFTSLLARSGIENHVEVLSFLADLGARMAEDSPAGRRLLTGGGGSPEPVDAADKLYGKKSA